jgi:hypothetical protein
VRDMRLPRHVVPSAYSLTLTPFIVPDNYTIQGSVHISATTQESENKCDSKVKPVFPLLCLWGWGKGVVEVDGSKLLHRNLSCRDDILSRLCHTCKISCKSPVSWIIAQPMTSFFFLCFFCAPKSIFLVFLCTVSGRDGGNRTRNIAVYTWRFSLLSYDHHPHELRPSPTQPITSSC